jgi:type 1 glutamine amidotransferase
MNRRQLLQRAGLAAAALGASAFPFGWTASADESKSKKRILMYTRSQAFEHSVVKRGKNGELSLAEKTVTALGAKHGFDVVCEKDGAIFTSKEFPTFDGFVFETTGDLTAEKGTDNTPPMSAEGKKNLLDAVAAGKGFVGSHCGSDTFHSKGDRGKTQPQDERDPYIAMLGGEFIVHGAQQKAKLQIADPNWPGLKDAKDLDIMEEWYALKNFAPDLHVILVMDTEGMKGDMYQRPPYPETWARKHNKGRVFFTSLGHREDVWESEFFQNLLAGGLAWSLGNVEADITPNIDKVTPKANDLPEKK